MAVTTLTISALSTSLFQDTVAANSAVTVKGSSAVITMIDVDNTANAAATYVKLWNSTGAITVGTTAPDMVLYVPASTRIAFVIPTGVTWGTGTQVAAVTTAGTAGSTSPTSATIVRISYT